MNDRDLDLATRLEGRAGTTAESVFEAHMAERGYVLGEHLWRLGFDRVRTADGVVATLPRWLRHTPDYVQVGGHLWEVQGTGAERALLVKAEKLDALHRHWHLSLGGTRQLRWALYAQSEEQLIVATHSRVVAACHHPNTEYREQLLDHKAGWRIPIEVLLERTVAHPFRAEKAAMEAAA